MLVPDILLEERQNGLYDSVYACTYWFVRRSQSLLRSPIGKETGKATESSSWATNRYKPNILAGNKEAPAP